MGDVWENSTLKAQLQQVATLVPIERVLVGKTSEARTHDTGPYERENTMDVRKIMAIPARSAARLALLPSARGGKEATMAARMENVMMKVPEPNKRGLLRPTRSIKIVMKLEDSSERS